MRGYVLQQETEANSKLMVDRELVLSKIAQYEAQDTLAETQTSQMMVMDTARHFAIIKSQALTAKK